MTMRLFSTLSPLVLASLTLAQDAGQQFQNPSPVWNGGADQQQLAAGSVSGKLGHVFGTAQLPYF